MIDMGWLVPVGVVSALTAGTSFRYWVRAKHGYPLDHHHGRERRRGGQGQHGQDGLGEGRKVELLTSENERLNGQVSRLEERIRVLERIVTDPATRTAREIDELR